MPTGSGKKLIISSLQLLTGTTSTAHLCHYIAINKSNMSFLHQQGNTGKATGAEGIVKYGCLTLEGLRKLELQQIISLDVSGVIRTHQKPQMLFAGTRRFLNGAKEYNGAYNLILIDEPQLNMADVRESREDNPQAKIVYFTALPPKCLYEDCSKVIEKKQCDVIEDGFLKRPVLVSVDTDAEWWEDDEVPYQNENLWAALIWVGKRHLLERRGMMIKCGTIEDAQSVTTFMEKNFVDVLKATHITSDLTPKQVEYRKREYEEGRIDVLVVCKMLSVGFHAARTSVLVCLCDMNFDAWLQFFGRGFSVERGGSGEAVYMVAADQFWERHNYHQKYWTYCREGVPELFEQGEYTELDESDLIDKNGRPCREPQGSAIDYIGFHGDVGESDVTWSMSSLDDQQFRRNRPIEDMPDVESGQSYASSSQDHSAVSDVAAEDEVVREVDQSDESDAGDVSDNATNSECDTDDPYVESNIQDLGAAEPEAESEAEHEDLEADEPDAVDSRALTAETARLPSNSAESPKKRKRSLDVSPTRERKRVSKVPVVSSTPEFWEGVMEQPAAMSPISPTSTTMKSSKGVPEACKHLGTSPTQRLINASASTSANESRSNSRGASSDHTPMRTVPDVEPVVKPVRRAPKTQAVRTMPMPEPVRTVPKAEPLRTAPKVEPGRTEPKTQPLRTMPMAAAVRTVPDVQPVKRVQNTDLVRTSPKVEPVRTVPKVGPVKIVPMAEPGRTTMRTEPKLEPVKTVQKAEPLRTVQKQDRPAARSFTQTVNGECLKAPSEEENSLPNPTPIVTEVASTEKSSPTKENVGTPVKVSNQKETDTSESASVKLCDDNDRGGSRRLTLEADVSEEPIKITTSTKPKQYLRFTSSSPTYIAYSILNEMRRACSTEELFKYGLQKRMILERQVCKDDEFCYITNGKKIWFEDDLKYAASRTRWLTQSVMTKTGRRNKRETYHMWKVDPIFYSDTER